MLGKVSLSKKHEYFYKLWNGEQLKKTLIAMDTETTVVEEEEKTADIVLTTASDGVTHVIIENKDLDNFMNMHEGARFVFYNVAFDYWVINKFIPDNKVLTKAAEENKLHDYMLLDMLYRLAVDDSYPAPRNLAVTSKIYAGLDIDKEDPYRMMYGTILGKPLTEVHPGFLEYAIKDTIATYFGFCKLFERAKKLAMSYGINSDICKQYGLFTESIQVKAAISLSKITKNGITLNTELSKELNNELHESIWSTVNQLNDKYPTLFKRRKKKRGELVEPTELDVTDNDVPRTNNNILREIFEQTANTIAAEEKITVKVPRTATGKITTSMKEWDDYLTYSDFLTKWARWTEQTKAKQFFKKLSERRIFPRYNYMVRTGRTSQQNPNCVSGDTEVLTNKGWMKFSDAYENQQSDPYLCVAQFDPKTTEISFTVPETWIKTQTQIWLNFTCQSFNLKCTPDHRVIQYERNSKSYFFTEADEVANTVLLPVSGEYTPEEEEYFPLSKWEIRVIVYILKYFEKCGDFYIWHRKKSNAYVTSLKYALLQAKIPFKYSSQLDNCYLHIHSKYLAHLEELCQGDIKEGNWIFRLDKESRDYLCKDVAQLGGVDKSWKAMLYAISGKVRTKNCLKTKKYIRIAPKRKINFCKQPEEAYCVTVSTGAFVVRSQNTIFITGNCQQIKKGRMREIIVPTPGFLLAAIDYSYIELRTLACIMEKLFGKSVMADVIRTGKDPHSFTGGMLVNLDYDEFYALKKTRPEYYDKWRQNAKACFHEDVEVLTPKGWKKISDILEKDLVAQYTKEGKVEFVHPTGTIKIENKNLYEVKSRHFSLRVTDDHNMYCLDWAEKPCTCKPKDFARKARKTVHAGYMEGAISDELSIRQAVAIQADGSIAYSQYSFGFKKERKIERFKELFENVFFKEVYDEKYGTTRFHIPNNLPYSKYLNNDKTFNTEEILKLDLTSRIAFIEELFYWDGSHKTERAFSFTSVNLDVINTVQAVAATCGYRTVFNEWVPNLSPNPAYSLGITKTETARPSKMSHTLVEENTTVYCIAVPSTLLIVKDKGSVQVCHNCNFGIPGGLSAPSLLNYAKNIYHIKDWTIETAKNFRDKICNEIYPELGKYLQEDSMRIMCEALECDTESAWERFAINGERSFGIVNAIKNIIIGKPFKKDGTKYNEIFVSKTWQHLNELNNNPTLVPLLSKKQGNMELLKQMFWTCTKTLTGRVRGKVSFTQNRNTPFQGLAADGAKLALFRLISEGFRIVNFVHDEIVFELPDLGGYVDKSTVDYLLKVMCEEMEKLTPGIPIAGEYSVDKCWRKDNKNMRIEGDRIYV